MSLTASPLASAAVDPAAASILAARLARLAERLGAAAAELAGADPGGGDSWRGVAREGFVAARSLAHGRLITAADAASDAASMAERAAELAALGV